MAKNVRKTILHSLEAGEVSFVKKGAIDRRFLILKSAVPVYKAPGGKWEESKHPRADDGKFGEGGGSGGGDKKPTPTGTSNPAHASNAPGMRVGPGTRIKERQARAEYEASKEKPTRGLTENEPDNRKTQHDSREIRESLPGARRDEAVKFHASESDRHKALISSANEAKDEPSALFHNRMHQYHAAMNDFHNLANQSENLRPSNYRDSIRRSLQDGLTDSKKEAAIHLGAAKRLAEKKPTDGGSDNPAFRNSTGPDSKPKKPAVDFRGKPAPRNAADKLEWMHQNDSSKKPTEKSAMAKKAPITKSFEEKVRGMIAKINPDIMKSVDERLAAWQQEKGAAPVEKDLADTQGDAGLPVDGSNGPNGALSEEAIAAIKAVVRILSGFKEELDPHLMHEVLEVIGYSVGAETDEPGAETDAGLEGDLDALTGDGVDLEGDPADASSLEPAADAAVVVPEATEKDGTEGEGLKDGEEPAEDPVEKDGDSTEGDEPSTTNEGDTVAGVSEEHLQEATDVANKAFKEHLQKLGYREGAEVEKTNDPVEEPDLKEKGETVTKRAESTVDLSQVDPQTRAKVEQVFKSNAELVKKTAELETAIKARDEKDRTRELVAKAAEWKHLGVPQDDIVAQLRDADKIGKDSFERVCKSFTALNEQAASAGLFGEIGSSQGSPVAGSSEQVWAKIEKAADGIVQKSAGSKTKEQAQAEFLQSSEGQRLYNEYKTAKGGI